MEGVNGKSMLKSLMIGFLIQKYYVLNGNLVKKSLKIFLCTNRNIKIGLMK